MAKPIEFNAAPSSHQSLLTNHALTSDLPPGRRRLWAGGRQVSCFTAWYDRAGERISEKRLRHPSQSSRRQASQSSATDSKARSVEAVRLRRHDWITSCRTIYEP